MRTPSHLYLRREIVSGQQRCGEEAPHGEMRQILIEVHAIAYLEHLPAQQ
eukprot:SAG31_NODE_6309_length_2071_cov_2.317444_2_plen_50_part_00